jgi:hypothetical protein
MMKRTIVRALVSLLSIAILACNNPLLKPKLRSGSISLSVTASKGRSIMPLDIAPVGYRASGAGPSGALIPSTASTSGAFSFVDIAEGSWTIAVDGLDSTGAITASGSATILVLGGSTRNADIALAPISGTGFLSLSVSWPSDRQVAELSGSLSPAGGSASTPISMAISGTTASYSGAFDTGAYVLTLDAKNAGIKVASTRMETVGIYNGKTSSWTATIVNEEMLSAGKDITAFAFDALGSTGAIAGESIAITVPYDTDTSALVATFSTTGASVWVAGKGQASGATANDFRSPVSYAVRAADGSEKEYAVAVTVAANPAKDITGFSFASPTATGVIVGTSIAVAVPYGSPVGSLVAAFSSSGSSVKVGSVTQVSGSTANDFTNPVAYVVTAADGSTKEYSVRVFVNPFVDNGDGTMLDTRTNLLWIKTMDSANRNWSDSNSYCASLPLAGGGWRMPAASEYVAAFTPPAGYASDIQGWLSSAGFSGVQSFQCFFWSSTAGGSGHLGYVFMGNGSTTGMGDYAAYSVWAVKAGAPLNSLSFDSQGGSTPVPAYISAIPGQALGALATTSRYGNVFGGWWTEPEGMGTMILAGTSVPANFAKQAYAKWTARFRDNGDGSMTDLSTGLYWTKSPSTIVMNCTQAYDYCSAITIAGFVDWRLPTIYEFDQLLSGATGDLAGTLNGFGFSGLVLGKYWSSTMVASTPSNNWTWDFNYHDWYGHHRLDTYYAWAISEGKLKASMPVISPASGAYSPSQEISISSATGGATIRYTLDGSIPSSVYGTIYAGPFSLSSNIIVTAIAYKAGWVESDTAAASFSVMGPGGGTVFYDKGSYSDGWRYMEAAPASTETTAQWGGYGSVLGVTDTAIGSGKANTETLVNWLNLNGESGRAAQVCAALETGGYSDWFLPSSEELDEMYINMKAKGLGGFANDQIYWSSSERDANYSNGWYMYSSGGYVSAPIKTASNLVRAIREF